MRKDFELSFWREYPGAEGIEEEKVSIIGADNMISSCRAQNIHLSKESSGLNTLTFDLPLKYFDELEGIDKINPSIKLIQDQSKLKLWRDEKWWNPFQVEKGYDDKGVMQYEGGYEQGRWYEFIVKSHQEKRSKRQLYYSYTCEDLFINELARTGYKLEFVADTDIMSANGMGTAHTLAERIVDGTDWEYIKTEIFPDYKEEFNPITGETVKIPLAVDQIDFLKTGNRYVNCYTLTVEPELQNEFLKQFSNKELYKFENNIFTWKQNSSAIGKNYVYGYQYTNIETKYAQALIAYSGSEDINDGTKNKDGQFNPILANSLMDSYKVWETDKLNQIDLQQEDKGNGFNYTLHFKSGSGQIPVDFKNLSCEDKAIEKGDCYVINIIGDGQCKLKLYDKNDIDNVITYEIETNSKTNYYNNSIAILVPKRIENPIFAINTIDFNLKGFFFYKLIGFNKKIEEAIKESLTLGVAKLDNTNTVLYNKLSSIGIDIDLSNNKITINNTPTYIWLGVGKVSQNEFNSNPILYSIEIEQDRELKEILLNTDFESLTLTKINSFDTDKRRAINGSNSNRLSLLNTVCSTFMCFLKFNIQHDERGYIKKNGKRFTFVSELGRQQFSGFTYGLNLENITRTIDSSELVTKVYVKEIDNQYNKNGIISIQNSDYNTMRESFFYNFSYFARQGFFDSSQFLDEYDVLMHNVERNNIRILGINDSLIPDRNSAGKIETSLETHKMIMTSLKDEAEKEMLTINWSKLKEAQRDETNNDSFLFPTINYTKFKDYGSPIYINTEYESVPIKFNTLEQLSQYMAYIVYVTADPNDIEELIGRGLSQDSIYDSLQIILNCQTRYNNYVGITDEEQSNLDLLKDKIKNAEEEIKALTDEKNNWIRLFENKYSRYILEGEWSGEDYIDANTYYLDATRAMSTSCMPKVSYDMTVIDLAKLCNPFNPEDTSWGDDFIYEVGDTTIVKDEELFVNGKTNELKAMISSMDISIDKDEADNITLRNFDTRFEELFQSIAATVTTLHMNENIYSRAENFTPEGKIDGTILQKSISDNNNLVISSSNNQVTQDNYGLTIKTDDGSGQVMRAVAGGIFFSEDNGNNFIAGLTPKGMNGSLITAGQIDTSKIVIRSSETPQYVFDTQGLTAYSNETKTEQGHTFRKNNFIRFDQYGLWMTNKGKYFSKDWWKSFSASSKLEELPGPDNLTNRGQDFIIERKIDKNSILKKIELKISANMSSLIDQVINFSIESKDFNIAQGQSPCQVVISEDSLNNKITIVLALNYYLPSIYITKIPNITIKYYYEDNRTNIQNYIEQYSIFSLTSKGLNVNSQGANGGSLKIRTEDSTLLSVDKNGNPRVKLGYIRSETQPEKRDIHGIDIYDGAFRMYGKSYEEIENFNTNDEASMWFEGNELIVNGALRKKYSNKKVEAKLSDNLLQFQTGNSYDPIYEGVLYGLVVDAEDTSGQIGVFKNKKPFTSGVHNFDNSLIIKGDTDKSIGILQETTINNPNKTSLLISSTDIRSENSTYFSLEPTYLYGYSDMIRIDGVSDFILSTYKNLSLEGESVSVNGTPISTVSIASNSDENLKHDISYLASNYSTLFDNLHPVTYRYNDGKSNRLHTGFIAQEVNLALEEACINTDDFAGLVIVNPGTNEERWTLRYEEFIALNTSEIQKLKKRVTELEDKISQLTKSQTSDII